jgi:lysophospholipase
MIFDRRRIPTDASVTMTPARDGWPLRTYFQPARGPWVGRVRGSILWLGGRGDVFEKYLESFDAWASAGRSVTSFDWRGQGGSGRLSANPNVGHIDDFSTWISDLTAFFDDWCAREPGPHFVMGHSMGGHLLLRALAENRIIPKAAIMSAPMFGFDSGPLPFSAAASIANAMARIVGHRGAWSSNEKPALPGVSRQAFLTHDDARYADELWWKQQDASLTLGPPSWSWLAAAFRSIAALRRPAAIERVLLPMLILGTDGDRLVSPAAIRSFAARLPDARLVMLGKEVAHEILRERDNARDIFMAEIAQFLDTQT